MKPPAFAWRKKAWSRQLAELVAPTLAPLLAKQGFGESEIVMAWPVIAGPRLAAVSEPIRLQWARQGNRPDPGARPEPAILHVRVDGGLAIELQHMQDVIVERINRHLGWRCVARLALKQGPLERGARRAPHPPAPCAEAVALAQAATAAVEAGPLRDALARLGARVLGEGK